MWIPSADSGTHSFPRWDAARPTTSSDSGGDCEDWRNNPCKNNLQLIGNYFKHRGFFKALKSGGVIMTSSTGNISLVTGPLWGEFTGHRWIPLTKASDAELWCFLWSVPEQTVEQKINIPVIWEAIAPIMTSLQWISNVPGNMSPKSNISKYWSTGGNRTKLPSSRWRRRGHSLREVFACSCLFATTDLSQIYNRETRRHGTPCTKTTDSYLFSFLYNDPRKIRRETTVGKFVPNNGRR